MLGAAAWSGALGVSGVACPGRPALADAGDEDREVIERLVGKPFTASPRVRVEMPPVFPNGYTVPLVLEVDSPMTESDHVLLVRILAPRNPIVLVASFHFTPRSGRARVSTRIRLAEAQNVVAVAEMSDGTVLMNRTWVTVATNGCA